MELDRYTVKIDSDFFGTTGENGTWGEGVACGGLGPWNAGTVQCRVQCFRKGRLRFPDEEVSGFSGGLEREREQRKYAFLKNASFRQEFLRDTFRIFHMHTDDQFVSCQKR